MNISDIIFYLISAVILGGALLAVVIRHIFRAAVFLLFSLIGIASLYFYLNYQFLAAVQVVVYVGGITVLIIFSIFLTADSGSKMRKPLLLRAVLSGAVALLSCLITVRLIAGAPPYLHHNGAIAEPGVRNIGRQLLSTTDHGYILPFELVSILLLAGMIGCIVIALKPEPTTENNE